MFKRLRQRLCSHGHGRYVIGNVCTICYKKLGETPNDRFIRETEILLNKKPKLLTDPVEIYLDSKEPKVVPMVRYDGNDPVVNPRGHSDQDAGTIHENS